MAEEPAIARLELLHNDLAIVNIVGDDDTTPATRTEADYWHELRVLPCLIGRGGTCAIRVRAHRTDISREHAVIDRSGLSYLVRDTGRHGTYVNGWRINGACLLDSGDTIGLASAEAMLRFLDPAQATIALTEREREILIMLAGGHQKKQIAQRLMISLNTVGSHVKNIYGKLGAGSVIEAVNQARKRGLIS